MVDPINQGAAQGPSLSIDFERPATGSPARAAATTARP
jgi:hypothetical protein